MTREDIRALAAQIYVSSLNTGWALEMSDVYSREETSMRIAKIAFVEAEAFAKVAKERKETP